MAFRANVSYNISRPYGLDEREKEIERKNQTGPAY
jgi:hypothetical protein